MGISDVTQENLCCPVNCLHFREPRLQMILPHEAGMLFHTLLHFQSLPFRVILPHALQKPFELPDFHSSSVRAVTRAGNLAREFLEKGPRCMACAVPRRPF